MIKIQFYLNQREKIKFLYFYYQNLHTHSPFFFLPLTLKNHRFSDLKKVYRGSQLDLLSYFLFLFTTSPPSGRYLNASADGDLTTLPGSSLWMQFCVLSSLILSQTASHSSFFLLSHFYPSVPAESTEVTENLQEPSFYNIFLQTVTNSNRICWSFFSFLLLEKKILSTFHHSKRFFFPPRLLVPTGIKSNKKSQRSIGLPSGFVT